MTPTRQLFKIAADLANARRTLTQAEEDIAFHIVELTALAFNSDDNVRIVCECLVNDELKSCELK